MRQYFYAVGAEKHGPVPLEGLREADIAPETLVWYEGLPDWRAAGDLPELASVAYGRSSVPNPRKTPHPPPVAPPATTAYTPTKIAPARRSAYDQLGGPPPKTYLLESILVTAVCCLPLGVVGIVNASKVESRYYAGDLEQAHYYSREAKRWTTYGLIGGAIPLVLGLLFGIGSL